MVEAAITLVVALLTAVLGLGAGFYLRHLLTSRRIRAAEAEAERLLVEAKTKQREFLLEAKDEVIRLKAQADNENRERRAEIQRQERRLVQKEEHLDRRTEALERRERNTIAREKEIENLHTRAEELKKQQLKELERISGLSREAAKDLLLKAIEDEVREDAARRIHQIELETKEEADQLAREVIGLSIQRCATEVVTESTVSVVPIPNDEMKGRIIGREGRNIRALENATGVDLIIDDTPDTVILSAFDPVRREIARVALNKLILDGRIHPARIEEMVEKAKQEVDTSIRIEGEQAAYEAGVHGLHPELIKLLGRLKYRYSYGQNVLQHSLEVAHLAGMIAGEIGADVANIKKAGLLHDIGKAVDHEVEGTHAAIGADILRRLDKNPLVIKAVAGHHGDENGHCLETAIVSVADALSSARPGARRESLEQYVKRLEALENVANSFEGVEKSFAIQAGREIRILVKPDQIDDLGAIRLARDIVKKVEETLEYPGQIKVMVVRETRAIDYAK